MNWRWYLTGITIALAFLGISIDKPTLPNQEIVVQFDANSVSSDEANHAISEITSQLKSIGIDDVQISKFQDGKLTVAYYSAIDVAVVKNLFNSQNKLQIDETDFTKNDNRTEFPYSSDSKIYKLEVVVIQKDFNTDSGLQGLPVATKHLKDQYLNPIVSLRASEIEVIYKTGYDAVAFKNYRKLSLLIDNTSYKIPEVRAGPFS